MSRDFKVTGVQENQHCFAHHLDCKSGTVDFRQYGFFSYLKDLFHCPDPVMAYLCLLYNVHKIPVGDETARRNVEHVIRAHPELRMFYTAHVQVKKCKDDL